MMHQGCNRTLYISAVSRIQGKTCFAHAKIRQAILLARSVLNRPMTWTRLFYVCPSLLSPVTCLYTFEALLYTET